MCASCHAIDASEALEAAQIRVTELTTALAEANDARMRHLGVNERLRARIAELEAAQRPPAGYVVAIDEPVGMDLPEGLRHIIRDEGDARDAVNMLRYNDPEAGPEVAYRMFELREREVQP